MQPVRGRAPGSLSECAGAAWWKGRRTHRGRAESISRGARRGDAVEGVEGSDPVDGSET